MVESINRALDGGGMNGLGLNVDDCRKTVEDLKSKGVEFIQEPEERPYGVEALMRDNSGNWMVLVEPRRTPRRLRVATRGRGRRSCRHRSMRLETLAALDSVV